MKVRGRGVIENVTVDDIVATMITGDSAYFVRGAGARPPSP